jgi:hypothetical protein
MDAGGEWIGELAGTLPTPSRLTRGRAVRVEDHESGRQPIKDHESSQGGRDDPLDIPKYIQGFAVEAANGIGELKTAKQRPLCRERCLKTQKAHKRRYGRTPQEPEERRGSSLHGTTTVKVTS